MNDSSEPRPGRLLIAASWLFLLAAAMWMAIGVTFYFQYDAVICVFILVLPAFWAGISQFLAAFRGHLESARKLTKAIRIFGPLGCAAFIMSSPIILLELHSYVELLYVTFVLTVACVTCTNWLNREWIQELEKLPHRPLTLFHLFRFKLSELLGLTSLVSVVAAITSAFLSKRV